MCRWEEENRGGWARRLGACSREIRKGVRSPRHRHQHISFQREGGQGTLGRRRLHPQHQSHSHAGREAVLGCEVSLVHYFGVYDDPQISGDIARRCLDPTRSA
ncbi:hypothetical protein LINGRAHAP2_LOCUS2441 [Linum grandiflorum]